jgi:hypothetical protein
MDFVIDAAHLRRTRSFSLKIFGPARGSRGVIDHIRQELVEIEENPGDLTEWADLIILAFDGAFREGHMPQDVLDAVLGKQIINEARKWPDWRDFDPDKAINLGVH